MTGSIQGSAIDDSFETLTNAPDAWVSGRYAAPPPVDYQHYVEPGDTRSAVDDRCFTEYGAVEHTRYVSKTSRPSKPDLKHRRSRQTSTKPPSHGKRRPSPSFRIRSKDGDSVVVSNPFVLRKPSRPQPRRESETSSQTDDRSHNSSTTAAHSRTFQIRIRGKNGEEAIQEIRRPLHFASQSGDVRESQVTTLVEDASGREDVKYWTANQAASSQKHDQRHKNKSGQPTLTDFVVDSSTTISSMAHSSVKMSGALPNSSPAPTTDSSRSRLLPPEKPASSLHDFGISVSRRPSKSPSRAISRQSKSFPESSSPTSSQNEVIIVSDDNDVMSAQFPTRPISRLTGHNGQVLALCYSAGTGQYLLTGSTDRQIRLFNPATGLEVQRYSAHGYEVHDLSVAQDNDRFISVGGDKTVFLWDVATHQTLRRWSGHAGRINACAFAGEGDSLVVTGSFDSTVKIWDCKQRSEKPIMTLSEAKDAVSSVSVSGAEIMAGSVDGRVRCYDVRMGVIDQDVLGHPITSVTPTVNNDSYLASTLDSTLRLMDKRDGKLLQAFRQPDFKNENYRLRSTLAAGDSLAISGSEDGHIYVWDLLTGNLSHKLKHSNPALTDGSKAVVSMSSKRDVVNSVAWNQLRKEWASAGGDGSVVVWGT
ncbi:WD40 repeat-like protein, partial [Aureobasidium melanogenum]